MPVPKVSVLKRVDRNYYSHPFHFLVLNMHSSLPLLCIDRLSEDVAFGSVSKSQSVKHSLVSTKANTVA